MLKANYEKVIVRVNKNPDVSSGGIIIPDSAVEKSNVGVVVDSGYDRDFEVGTTVYFPLYKGHEIVHDNITYLVLSADDILAYDAPEDPEDSFGL